MAISTAKIKEVDTKTPYSPKETAPITVGPHHRPYHVEQGKRSDYALPDVLVGHEHLWEKFGRVPDGTTSA